MSDVEYDLDINTDDIDEYTIPVTVRCAYASDGSMVIVDIDVDSEKCWYDRAAIDAGDDEHLIYTSVEVGLRQWRDRIHEYNKRAINKDAPIQVGYA